MSPAGLGSGLQVEFNSVSCVFTLGSQLREQRFQRKALLKENLPSPWISANPRGKSHCASPFQASPGIYYPTGQNQPQDHAPDGWGGEYVLPTEKGRKDGYLPKNSPSDHKVIWRES